MPTKTIGELTQDATPVKAALVEIETPVPATRSVTLETIRKLVLGEPLTMPSGTDAASGVGVLVAGTVTINTHAVTSTSKILVFPQETGTLTGILRVSARVAGNSFTVSSSVGTDTAHFAWALIDG